jgi:ectoine hydroxylase-related dioxygenase (phytanoyl-CoA dioxygenase family)
MEQPSLKLTQDQIDRYQEQGFLAIDAITTPEEVERVSAIIDRLFEERAGRETGDQFDLGGTDDEGRPADLPQILNPSRYAPELAETRMRANAVSVVRQILGPEANVLFEHAILKPGARGAPTPWHQDEAYGQEDKEIDLISVWVPLQDTSVEMGCMQFIPGTHEWEVQPHHPINHDPRIHGLEIDTVDASQAVACPLPAGGATLHGSRTLHYAGPNTTGRDRRSYIMMIAKPVRDRKEPRDFYWIRQQQTARMKRAAEAAGKE